MLATSEEILTPFIARYAEKQLELSIDNNQNYYDEHQDVTVSRKSGKPLVDSSLTLAEMMTKTEATRESEDTHSLSLLAFETTTAVKREAADFDYALSEFQTKTKAERESDDAQYCLLEFLTETRVASESGDPQDSALLL